MTQHAADIIVEKDEETQTTWLTQRGVHYPFSGLDDLNPIQDLEAEEYLPSCTDAYQRFKERQK